MSDDGNHQQDQSGSSGAQHQPVFLLPTPVIALCGLLLAIQAADALVLNDSGREALLTWFAFVPYRLIDPANIEGGLLPLIWTPITHAFLHAGWEHVLLNTVWLAIFATPVTRRYGPVAMILLFLVGAVVGAVAFAVTTLPSVQVLVGASGGIAALTGAAVRFVFQPLVVAVDPETGERKVLGRRFASLADVLRNPTARLFALVWIVINGVVPLAPLLLGGQGVEVAWQAHLGGFLAGFVLVPVFEERQQ